MKRLLGLVLLVAGCSGGHSTGPSGTVWRGAAVEADDPPHALDLLDQAYRGWEPVGWTIVFHRQRFPCPNAYGPDGKPTHDGHCRGLTQPARKQIDTVYELAVVQWELGNARCGTLFHDWRDTGGRC